MDIKSLASASAVSSTISAITSSTVFLVELLCAGSCRRFAISFSRSVVEILGSCGGDCSMFSVNPIQFEVMREERVGM